MNKLKTLQTDNQSLMQDIASLTDQCRQLTKERDDTILDLHRSTLKNQHGLTSLNRVHMTLEDKEMQLSQLQIKLSTLIHDHSLSISALKESQQAEQNARWDETSRIIAAKEKQVIDLEGQVVGLKGQVDTLEGEKEAIKSKCNSEMNKKVNEGK